MQFWLGFFLFFHVLGAIVALGPTFAFALIGTMGGNEPQHANFATRVSHAIGDRIVEPVILTMPLTGIGLIWAAQIDILSASARWLVLGILIYIATLTFSLAVQRPAVKRVIALTGGHPGVAPSMAAGAASSGPGAMGVPPAELPDAITAVQRGGMIMLVAALAIIFLMVVKPSLGF